MTMTADSSGKTSDKALFFDNEYKDANNKIQKTYLSHCHSYTHLSKKIGLLANLLVFHLDCCVAFGYRKKKK